MIASLITQESKNVILSIAKDPVDFTGFFAFGPE